MIGAFEYFKHVIDDLYLSIYIYDDVDGATLTGLDIDSMLDITLGCYYLLKYTDDETLVNE